MFQKAWHIFQYLISVAVFYCNRLLASSSQALVNMDRIRLLSLLLILLFANQTWAQKRKQKCITIADNHQALRFRENRHITQTKFKVYEDGTDDDFCEVRILQPETLEKCSFNASLPLVILVHGWSINGILESWLWKMGSALKSKQKPINVIIADWLSYAYGFYPTAAQNTRVIGMEIAELLEWLESTVHFQRSNVHLIGYSLGAHVAGFAGSYITGPNKIARITGLDPAGPLFEGVSSVDRLSPDDADFVDAIHTFTQLHMGLSVGIKQAVGHFDFYPNGGEFQPGCHFMNLYNHLSEYGIHGFKEPVKCAHERSVNLFVDSLVNDDKQSMGYWCKDIKTFIKGVCLNCRKNRCNTLGYNIQKKALQKSRKFFLITRAQMPYKVFHYQIKINVLNQLEKQLDPKFTVSLIGTLKDALNLELVPIEAMNETKTYSFLITLEEDIGNLMMVKMKWEGVDVWSNILESIQTIWTPESDRPGLLLKEITVKSGESQQKIKFCSENIVSYKLLPTQEKTYVRCAGSSGKQSKRIQTH
ncbi:hepatic triacylglycerol lipase isoform X1 [Pelobates cultripes]|uniref:Hepatic triacylglycerol lipase n=2 Tax=Pelobates cultripes TaxID=61616 RepID=A0AAD1RLE4_PELCU|nr:hepatic triacylglycerol lipase isoform X1 [Pelobates cultripes]